MEGRIEKQIYKLSATCGILVGLSLVIPRLAPDSEGGLAGAATAVLMFLGVLAVAAALSVYLFLLTLRSYRDIGKPARWAGMTPGVLLVGGLAFLVLFLRY